MAFHLMRPEWLLTLVPAALLALLLWRQRGREGNWGNVISPELLPHLVGKSAGGRRLSLLPVLLIAWLVAALAASGPAWEKIPQPVLQKQDAVVLLLDLSYSMKSTDLPPSRLDRARQKLLDLLEQRREGQTGLIAYAGDSHIVTPLTDDTPTIANLLPALSPDMMPVAGSDPVAAVEQAVQLLHSAGIRQGKLLLVTDDIEARERPGIEQALAGSGAQLSVMGVGTSTGAPIPLPRGGFLKDGDGAIVMPGLSEDRLRSLANAVGGRYMRMQIDNSDLDYLLADTGLPAAEDSLVLDRTADSWHDAGFLLVLLLLPLALAMFRRGWLLCLLPLLLVTTPERAQAQAWDKLWLTPDQRGQRAMEAGDAERAAELFENPDWAGTAAYESGDYESALQHFEGNDSADGWYNRGNAQARSGQLDEAIEAYRQSLELEPGREDAEHNLELLEQLKQQQEQQQQEQQQDQNQQDQDNQEQDQQQERGQSEGESQQDGQQQDQQSEQQQQEEGEQDQSDSQQQAGDPDEQDPQDQEQQQQQASEQEPQKGEQEAGEQGTSDQAEPEERERDQAMEQWLRRVPDDPSGLLREKFRYESRQRQQQGNRRNDENYW